MPETKSPFQPADLTSCDREPIHVPGSIQPHGFLLQVHGTELTVIQVSDNVPEYLNRSVEDVLGKPLLELIGRRNIERIATALLDPELPSRPYYLDALELGDGRVFDVVAHRHAGASILEFEPVSENRATDVRLMYPLGRTFLPALREAATVDEISELAAHEIRTITGFGRVLVYRFDQHYHGQVIAEEKDSGYHSYLHQRFPASDIPRQARELYLKNHIRLIADANYLPSRLVPVLNPLTGVPTDLTFAGLRSVSPVHLQYMRNMETMASMSISLIVKGRLWGLISCHNTERKTLLFQVRAVCEQLGQIISLQLEAKEETQEYNYRLELRRILVTLLSALSNGPDFISNLATNGHLLLQFANASGAAIVFEGKIVHLGSTPASPQIVDLIEWIDEHQSSDIFHTSALSTLYPEGGAIREMASGVMALPISKIHRHYLIWFRSEVVRTLQWAGNPHLKSETPNPDEALSPRRSFDVWKETVFGTSQPWRKSEIETALEFRVALLGVVLRRAEEMAELAEELGRANKELESFSYSVSHDLRAPLRHIVGYTDLLSQYEGVNLTERGNRFLKNIIDSARFAGKLVDDLLSFSQMGRAALRPRNTDMAEIVQSVIRQLAPEMQNRHVEWEIGDMPVIMADPVFVQLAIQNLLSNAVKYTRHRTTAHILISAEETENEHVFHVADNGVGFNMKYVQKLFGVFQRLHRMEEFEGTGIGLANVRRIVERHGGRTWAQGIVDKGATFSFAIPKNPVSTGADQHA